MKINARVHIRREQVIEVYDADGGQKTLIIPAGGKYDGELTDESFSMESRFGVISIPRDEVFFLGLIKEAKEQ